MLTDPTASSQILLQGLAFTRMHINQHHDGGLVDAGSAGGLSLASASIVCTGPDVPVPMTGSTALAAYATTFQGVSFAQDTDPDGEYIAALYEGFWVGALPLGLSCDACSLHPLGAACPTLCPIPVADCALGPGPTSDLAFCLGPACCPAIACCPGPGSAS